MKIDIQFLGYYDLIRRLCYNAIYFTKDMLENSKQSLSSYRFKTLSYMEDSKNRADSKFIMTLFIRSFSVQFTSGLFSHYHISNFMFLY